jgi:hypothetical protein
LLIEAGTALHPVTEVWIELGLPFGPKPRLILAHLNAEALRQGRPIIEVEDSLTAFVRRIQDPLGSGKSGPNGYEIGIFKDQLSRLATATRTSGSTGTEISGRDLVGKQPLHRLIDFAASELESYQKGCRKLAGLRL